ncbi:hypothetical protein GCM10010211_61880 [Streptomyces albospinus]|uniref:Uncharacterized protein n=1 Tax=Streptomyces albospinus TaxID=285515 RepID=A0ABQ2VIE2_9ACTN|nr:hypothetical protein GCM10010211_61880 [Streptomyces albospinus]
MAAFPSRLAGDVRSVLAVMPFAAISPVGPFRVEVQGEAVAIPSRIYHAGPDAGVAGFLTGTQQLILHCLYSRRSDYWSCHYRWKYPMFGTCPGGILTEAFRAAASEQVGAPWRRHTPPTAGSPAGDRSSPIR